MTEHSYKYIIAGAGLAGMSAIEGLRKAGADGAILLAGNESVPPYERPPLTKKLWTGKKNLPDIFPHDSAFYLVNGVDVKLGVEFVDIDPASRTLTDLTGDTYRYDVLLLATGGVPRTLDIPGGGMWGVCYYRRLHDYLRIRRDASEGKSAVVIGGGFIGSEIAASLNMSKVDVTMVFPEQYPASRLLPESLGRYISALYTQKGVTILAGDVPVSIERDVDKLVTHTKSGRRLVSDMVIAGLGIMPSVDLARKAGLEIENGIKVDEFLRTSNPAIYAAGDNTFFPYLALGTKVRVEHWDNAINQGLQAGKNMAGASEPYSYMPYFWSDMFEFGYEAVGELDSRMEVFADWEKENEKGVLYYLKDGGVRGVMTCGIYGKMDDARALITSGRSVAPSDLAGAIKE